MKSQKFSNEENNGFFNKLNKIITKKTVTITGLLAIASYVFLNTLFVSLFQSKSNGYPYIDVQIFNSAQEFYYLISSYGPLGRSTYIQFSLGFDFILPLIFWIFFIFAGIYIFRKISNKIIWQKIIFFIPLLCILTDWFENISFMILIMNYPTRLYTLFYIASNLTLVKSILTIIPISIIIIGLIILIVKKLRNKPLYD